MEKQIKRSALQVEKIYANETQKEGTLTVQLRQEIETITTYPGIVVKNEKQGNIFNETDFDVQGATYPNTEKRVAWILVPDSMSLEDVKAKMATYPDACLYKELSSEPIFTSGQIAAMESDNIIFDKEKAAQNQLVIDGATGEIVMYQGKPQYRRVFFSEVKREDVDNRVQVEIENQEATIGVNNKEVIAVL